MHDISTLETQWKQYKAKQRKPYYIASFAVVILSTTFFILKPGSFSDFSFNISLLSFDRVNTRDMAYNRKSENATLLNGGLKHLEGGIEKTSQQIELTIEPEETLVDIPILDLSGGQQSTKVHRSKNIKMNLEIIETSSISAYRDVEERFLKSKDIDDAFFLAKSYFNKGDYEKSGYWALETNKLDASHEESLLIFAESKVKLGQKSEGISILKRYIGKTNSSAARNLLGKIESGRF
ncbi:MAG: hypothetical protein GQ531_02615 [Sulfurovum sp.]|nr:hypothetical protein [Sulfurovum sp.]